MPPPRRSLPSNPFHGSSAGRWECRPLQSLPPNPFHGSLAGEGFIPPGLCAHIAAQHKKAGANISFAPAVLLLRSHSLITLTRYFSDCTLVFIRIILTLRFCLALSGSQFTCSLVLPSGSLFAQKHLWNGVMFVIKIVLGVVGLMPRTKAS